MSNKYVSLDELADEIRQVLALYGTDPEGAHAEEDRLIERFVRDRGYEGDERAMLIISLLDRDRRRWYA